MIPLPEIKIAELSTYRNFAKYHQAYFRIPRSACGPGNEARSTKGQRALVSINRATLLEHSTGQPRVIELWLLSIGLLS